MTQPVNVAMFSVVDYLVFILVLVASLGIGAYYGIRGNKTTDEFFLAGRSMSPIPVALSLIATFISSLSLLGYVGEVYGNGLPFIWLLVGAFLGMLTATKIFIPIIYPLKLKSVNEYFLMRFRSQALAQAMLVITSFSNLLYLGLCLYAPTLALESVTPVSSGTYILILGIVVTLYSSYGGMKAVVWTDAVQTIIMVGGVLMATISAIIHAGGIGKVLEIGREHGRTEANIGGIGLYERHTVFNCVLMGFVNFFTYYSFAQPTIQRFGTMPSIERAQMLMYMNIAGLIALKATLFFTGLCIFASYADCDPLTLGFIHRKDQIFPYYVMDKMGFLKGIPGIFVACLFSGTMSSISSVLNSVPTMLFNDFIVKLDYFQKSSERVKTIFSKILTGILGVIMIALAFLSSKLGGLIQAAFTIMSVMSGPSLGVFFLGFCVPICTKKGAMVGLIVSLVFMSWLGIGVQLYGGKAEMLPFSVEGCSNETLAMSALLDGGTETGALSTITPSTTTRTPLAGFYGISYTFLSTFGSAICVIIGTLVSLATGKEDLDMIDPKYVLPCFRSKVGAKLKTPEEKLLVHDSPDASDPVETLNDEEEHSKNETECSKV